MTEKLGVTKKEPAFAQKTPDRTGSHNTISIQPLPIININIHNIKISLLDVAAKSCIKNNDKMKDSQ